MPQFLTRQSNLQQQPQAAQLPFSQFGGQRGPLQGDTTGGIAFPDAGQPEQGQPQQEESGLSPFMLPTGLTREEMNALLGTRPSGRIGGVDFRSFKTANGRSIFDIVGGTQTQQIFPGGPQLPPEMRPGGLFPGGIPFEGGGGFDKFNPKLAGGIPINNINLLQSPNLSTANLPSPNPDLFKNQVRNLKGGGF